METNENSKLVSYMITCPVTAEQRLLDFIEGQTGTADDTYIATKVSSDEA